jgi:hypothetical protein
MKTTATRSTEIFIDCPKCNCDITYIPDKEISDINLTNTEKLHCPKCKIKIEITEVL